MNKVLTEDDVNFLIAENWLTQPQQEHFDIFPGVEKTWEDIEKICPDQTVLYFIFEEDKNEITNVQYKVVNYFYGESTFSEVFNNFKDAVLAREKLIKSTHPDNVRIEVSYDLKGSN